MEEHDDVGSEADRGLVTGDLVGAVAQVSIVADRRQAEVCGLFERVVGAGVVHQDYVVDDVAVELVERSLQRHRSVVSGQYHRNPLTVEHGASVKVGKSYLAGTAVRAYSASTWRCEPGTR